MLNGQIALVTGASRGIGRAIALELGALGATVIGTATSPEGAAKISAFLSDAGSKGEGCMLEVRDATQVDALIRHIEKAHGAVTVLVNNAGITRDNLAMRLKDDDWDTVIDTDLKAVFGLSRAVIRGMMKARQGRIINVTSVVGHAGNPGQVELLCSQGRGHRHEPGTGARTGQSQHHGQLRCARLDRYRHDKGARRQTEGCHAGERSAWSSRVSAGCGSGGGVSRFSRGGLCHRNDDSRQWRHVPGLTARSRSGD
jgi:NAD(P)-dependent dehydrogenase (short-subunit alcohol dehydrogenase family)